MSTTAPVRANAPRIGMTNVVRAEFTKFLTLPSVWIVTAVICLIFTYMHVSAISDQFDLIEKLRASGGSLDGERGHSLSAELSGMIITAPLNAGLLLPMLGAVIAGTEFRAGQLGLSMVAVPRRARFITGKVIAAMLYVCGLWIVFTAVGYLTVFLTVKDWEPSILWDSELFVSYARLLLFMVTATLIGFGITLLTRSTLVGIVFSVVSIMLVFAQVVAMVSPSLDAILVPFSAARNLLLQGQDSGPPTTAGALHGALVLIGWALLTVGSAAVAMTRRDAR